MTGIITLTDQLDSPMARDLLRYSGLSFAAPWAGRMGGCVADQLIHLPTTVDGPSVQSDTHFSYAETVALEVLRANSGEVVDAANGTLMLLNGTASPVVQGSLQYTLQTRKPDRRMYPAVFLEGQGQQSAQQHGWFVVQMNAKYDGSLTNWLAIHHRESAPRKGKLFVPRYEGLYLAQSLLRSRILGRVIDGLRWPETWPVETVNYVRGALRCIHLPSDEESAAWGQQSSVRGYIQTLLDPFCTLTQADLARLKEYHALRDELRASGQVILPPRRLVKTAEAAEHYAAEFMDALGFSNVFVTPRGADGGVDVESDEALAQVKMEGVNTGRPVIQAIYGVGAHRRKDALFFSLAGYTAGALAWANEVGVACFEFALDGEVVARNDQAEELLKYGYLNP